MISSTSAFAAAIILVVLVGCRSQTVPTTTVAQTPAGAAPASGTDWPSYNGTLAGARYSGLTQITTANVGQLRPICTFDTEEQVSFSNGPIVIAGTVYVSSDTVTYAFDGATCALRWRTRRPYPPPLSFLGGNRGLAYLDGKVFRGAGDANIYALDASTGRILWDVSIGEHTRGESAPAAPIAWRGMVFAGNAGGDNYAVRGRVHAMDANTGRVLWSFASIPDTGYARSTWPAASADNPPTGGGFWSSFTLDTLGGILYVPAGNPAPDFAEQLHPGLNLYANSIIALDARSGKLLGYVQPVRGDFHDWDVSATPALVTTRGGRQILATPAKDGFLYGIERSSGTRSDSAGQLSVPLTVRYRAVTTTRGNTQTPLSSERETRFCPGSQGGTEWNGAAYHPDLNLVYTGAVDWCTTVRLARLDTLKGKAGGTWTGAHDGGFGRQDPKAQWRGWITAADADVGTVRWKYQAAAPVLAAVTPTAGGLLFSADVLGKAFALDARTGKVLWQHASGEGMIGGVVTYLAGGRQRVAYAAGAASPIWPLPRTSSRVIIYGLP